MSLDHFHRLILHGLGLYRIRLGLHDLGLTYIFGPFHYHLGPKKIFLVSIIAHRIQSCLYELKPQKKNSLGLLPTMRPQIKLSAYDVEF